MERSSGIVQVASLVPSTTPPSVIRPSGSLTLKPGHFRGGVSIVPAVDTVNWRLVSGCWFNVNFAHLYSTCMMQACCCCLVLPEVRPCKFASKLQCYNRTNSTP